MKNDSFQFGKILQSLNVKVNKRASYHHDSTFKYTQGSFRHTQVISNLKNEPCLQTPRSFIPIDLKFKPKYVKTNLSKPKPIEFSLNASLVRFYSKEQSKPSTRNKSFQTCRIKF